MDLPLNLYVAINIESPNCFRILDYSLHKSTPKHTSDLMILLVENVNLRRNDYVIIDNKFRDYILICTPTDYNVSEYFDDFEIIEKVSRRVAGVNYSRYEQLGFCVLHGFA